MSVDPSQIAKLITENINESNGMNVPLTPSQVFSQVLMHGWDPLRTLEQAIQAVEEFGMTAGLSPELIEQAIQFTTVKYEHLAPPTPQAPPPPAVPPVPGGGI